MDRFVTLKNALQTRSKSGSLAMVLVLVIVMAVMATCAIGFDLTHNMMARTALQNAADAAALAGAAKLVTDQTTPSATSLTSQVSGDAQSQARSVAGANIADGKSVSASTPGCTVAMSVKQPGPSNPGQTCPSNNGEVQVDATMPIQNYFAGLFGHPTDNVAVRSIATAYSTMKTINQNGVFPIAVSLDTQNGHKGSANDKPLYQCNIGDTETFCLAEPCANAAWTSLNAQTSSGTRNDSAGYINSAIDSSLGISYTAGTVPEQSVGEVDSNGVVGIDLLGDMTSDGSTNVKDISSGTEYSALLNQTIVLPVMAGDPPYRDVTVGTPTQPGAQSRPLLGFVGFKVTEVGMSNGALNYIRGKIVKALVKGAPGIVNPVVTPLDTANNATLDAALNRLSPGMIQLASSNLQNDASNVVAANLTDTFAAGSGAIGGGTGGTTDDTSGAPAQSLPSWMQNLLTNNGLAKEPVMLGGMDNGYSMLTTWPNQPFTVQCLYHDESVMSGAAPPYAELRSFNNGVDGSAGTTVIDSTDPNSSSYQGDMSINVTQLANNSIGANGSPPGPGGGPGGGHGHANAKLPGDTTYEYQISINVPAQSQGNYLLILDTHDGDHTQDEGRHIWSISAASACP